jgi:hypothetical protein
VHDDHGRRRIPDADLGGHFSTDPVLGLSLMITQATVREEFHVVSSTAMIVPIA